MMLERRLRDALAELNPDLSASALDDAFRRLTHSEGAFLYSLPELRLLRPLRVPAPSAMD